MSSIGCKNLRFEPPAFDYDMFFVAGREPLTRHANDQIDASLMAAPVRRLVLALLDKAGEEERIHALWKVSEDNRAARLNLINRLTAQLAESEADRAARLNVINHLAKTRSRDDGDLETVKAACLEAVDRLTVLAAQLAESKADRAARLDAINHLATTRSHGDGDLETVKAVCLEAVDRLKALQNANESNRAIQLELITILSLQVAVCQKELAARRNRVFRRLKRLPRRLLRSVGLLKAS